MALEWVKVSDTELRGDEERAILDSLVSLILEDEDTNTATVVGYNDDLRSHTTIVYSVSLISTGQWARFVGTIYEHPGRTVVVALNSPKLPSKETP